MRYDLEVMKIPLAPYRLKVTHPRVALSRVSSVGPVRPLTNLSFRGACTSNGTFACGGSACASWHSLL